MSTENNNDASSMEQACTCWICFELFEEPITLSCGHTLCRNCLTNVFKKDPQCPFCRRPFGLPFPCVNETIEALVAKYKSAKESTHMDVEKASPAWDESVSGPQPPLFRLPDAVLNRIFIECGPSDVVTLSMTSKYLYEKTQSPFVWREFCRSRWPFVTIDKYRNWRSCYAAHHAIMRGWSGGRPGDFKMTTFRGHTNYIADFGTCHSLIASASADGTAKIWDATKGTVLRNIDWHKGPVTQALLDEVRLITGSEDRMAAIWDVHTGEQVHKMLTTSPVTAIRAFGNLIFVGGANGQVKLWDAKLGTAKRVFGGRTDPIIDIWLQGSDLFACGSEGVKVYDMSSGRCRSTFSRPTSCFFADAQGLVVGSGTTGTVAVWSQGGVATGAAEPGWEKRPDQGATAGVSAMTCDSERVVAGYEDGTVVVWNRATGDIVHTLLDHKGRVNSIQMDDKKIVTSAADNTVKVWDLKEGTRLYSLLGGSLQRRANNPPHPTKPGISAAMFDESRIVASVNSLIRVYDFDTATVGK